MLKIDLHIHAKEDKEDEVKYDAKELIDKAHEMHYDVLSFTFHDSMFYNEDIIDYANEKDILLLPGIEKTIEGKHVVLINYSEKEIEDIRHFEDLCKIKKEDGLIIAAHPYFFKHSLGSKFKKHIHCFDVLENAFFYLSWFNRNNKAAKIAKMNHMPIIANSDLHHMEFFGTNYTLVESKKDTTSLIHAIKKGKVKVKSRPLSLFEFVKVLLKVILK